MMFRLWRIMLILIPMSMSAQAQTANELKQKYSLLENGSYLVRPNIILTVTFDENGRACRMQIDPQKTSISNRYSIDVISRSIADEIIDEIAPVSRRGKLLMSLTFNGGCSGVGSTTFENVEISVASTCAPNGGGITSARIIWRKTTCWEDYQRKSSP